MFKYYFNQIEHIEVFPIIALLIFFSFFVLLLIWIFRIDKSYIAKMKNLPIDQDEELNHFSLTQNKEQ